MSKKKSRARAADKENSQDNAIETGTPDSVAADEVASENVAMMAASAAGAAAFLMEEPEAEEAPSEEEMEAEGLIAEPAEEEAFLPGDDDTDPEVEAEVEATDGESAEDVAAVEGTELEGFESAEIEETEFIEDERLESIIESILFASDRPVGLGAIKMVFKGTNVKTERIKRVLNQLAVEYAGGRRGVTLDEVPGGWQLRTKVDNMEFLRRTLKTRSFRLSGPALEVLSIVAYKQPVIKHEIDEIRGVESGHLLRALMEKNLVCFGEKSDLPGRPMFYETTRKFLEIFSLRNLKELPTLSQIDELLPEGIGEEETAPKPKLADVTEAMSESITTSSYSVGEEELEKIQEQLEKISTSSDFFEKEKLRQRENRDRDRAQNIRDAMAVGEAVPTRDVNWLRKYDEALAAGTSLAEIEERVRAEKFAAMKSGEGSSVSAGAEAAGPAVPAEGERIEEAEALFEEDAPHPEDELPMEAADIEIEDEPMIADEATVEDEADDEGEGHAEV